MDITKDLVCVSYADRATCGVGCGGESERVNVSVSESARVSVREEREGADPLSSTCNARLSRVC